MKRKTLGKEFFNRPVLIVAENLLGKFLVRRVNGKVVRFMITEVEAYDGLQDKASHARFGLTKRNAPMFEQGGVWYVYFTYGVHWLLNVVCGKKGHPAAILIRGVDGISGPARITKALKIDKKFNNKIASPKTGLWIEDNPGFENLKFKIENSPRIGVNYAGPIWSKKPWRFVFVDKNR
jgi:DNA-3-methyladenine glycosylase